MMTKLKGFLFGKLLKPLFIISSISCFTLLGSCFVNAGVVFQSVGTYQVPGFSDYTQTIYSTTNGKITKGSITNNYFMIPACPYNNTYGFVFRGTDKNLYIANVQNGNLSYIQRMVLGFITTPDNSWDGFTPTYIPLYNSGLATIPTNTFANDLNYDNNLTRIAYYTYDNNCQSSYIGGVCFIYDSLNESVCFSPNYKTSSYENISYIMSGGLVVSPSVISGFNILFSGVNYSNTSPWIGYFPPTFENVNLNNYNSMYQSYLRKGYKDVLCYGGFGLDNLYNTGDSLSGLVVNSGATVFDLYHAYGSGLHFSDWYNQNDDNFIYFNSFRDGYEASNFIGKSKGLLGLGLVKQIYWKSNDPFLSNDLQIFCNIVINHSEEIDHNTWEGSIFDDYLDQNKLNQLIGDIGVVVPTVGTPLDLLWDQYMSGSSSFSGCNSPEECITNGGIDKSVDLAWKTWSIEGLRGNITGILPWYIVFGFLGIMFLYYLRR